MSKFLIFSQNAQEGTKMEDFPHISLIERYNHEPADKHIYNKRKAKCHIKCLLYRH